MYTPEQKLGLGALALGGLAIVVTGGASFFHSVKGDVPAVGTVLMVVGLVLVRPDLIEGDDGKGSAMRVSLLTVVSIFALLTIKAGWATTSLAELKIDASWAWVLAAGLGGKAVQSFSEFTGKTPPAPRPAADPIPAIDRTAQSASTPGPDKRPRRT